MHMQGAPKTMQAAPQYADVAAEVEAFLAHLVAAWQVEEGSEEESEDEEGDESEDEESEDEEGDESEDEESEDAEGEEEEDE